MEEKYWRMLAPETCGHTWKGRDYPRTQVEHNCSYLKDHEVESHRCECGEET